jgi:Zinc finger, C2H2 type
VYAIHRIAVERAAAAAPESSTLKEQKQHESGDMVKCDECDKMMKDAEALSQHKRAKHSATRPPRVVSEGSGGLSSTLAASDPCIADQTTHYECHICGLVCEDEAALDRHIRTGWQPVVITFTGSCPYCQRANFRDLRALNQHMACCTPKDTI